MIIDANELDAHHAYKLLIATVLPRPIGWLSTLSTDGVPNIAPFSFFTVVGRKPPILSISMQPRSDDGTLKDSFINIRDTGEFVAHLVTLEMADKMHQTARDLPPETDEFAEVGLERLPSEVVKPWRIAGPPIAMECKVDRIIPVGEFHDHVVWGRVVRFHIRDDLYLENGRVDTAAFTPIGRLAAEYTAVDNVFTTPLEAGILEARRGRRMHRLDGLPADFAAVAQKNWSPSGAVTEKVEA
ncbi:MAG TPA: flavin reductase family protein [Acetobacteraceae bacterium]|nr:flavin reductase family protein [Acetobacteraceae bacterium]